MVIKVDNTAGWLLVSRVISLLVSMMITDGWMIFKDGNTDVLLIF